MTTPEFAATKGLSVFEGWRNRAIPRINAHSQADVQRWLEGYSLPPIDNYTEGHVWLLEAVKDKPEMSDKLARITVNLLSSCVTNRVISTNVNRLLFNLFYLCSGLRRPTILWKPLLELLDNLSRSSDRRNTILGQQYEAISLITAFRAALTQNQGDDRLVPVWRKMLERVPHPILEGTPMDGFEGIVASPSISGGTLVGWALARMADYLDSSPFREDQFDHLLRIVHSRLGSIQLDFLRLAVVCGWKPWAVELVGDPRKLVKIEYANVNGVEVIDTWKIRVPESFSDRADELEPTIRELAIDFAATNLSTEYLSSQIEEVACTVAGNE